MTNKKLWRVASTLFVSSMLLAACGNDDEEPTEPEEPDTEVEAPTEEPDVEDENGDSEEEPDETEDEFEVSQDLETWFPLLEDVHLEYEGEGMEYSSFTRYPQFTHDSALQMVESTAGTDVVTIYDYSDDQIEEVFIRPETYFREDFVDTGFESEHDGYTIILQAPIEVGHSWESPNGTTSEITDVGVEMDTPNGTVEAIEVETIFEDGITLHYYGEDMGLIERVTNPGEGDAEVSSTLIAFDEEQPEEMPITIYSLDDQAMGIDATPTTMELMTNDPARLTLAEFMRGEAPDSDLTPIITEGVDLNYLYLRDDEESVHADFSVELTEEMNAGAGIESMIIQGIVNSIGDYYNVGEVLLTVDGEPYSSGHIAAEEGETWPVDYSNVNE